MTQTGRQTSVETYREIEAKLAHACERCGLCSWAQRKSIVAFRAHGQFAAQVEARL